MTIEMQGQNQPKGNWILKETTNENKLTILN